MTDDGWRRAREQKPKFFVIRHPISFILKKGTGIK
jgi:hypothetical protein